MIETLALRTCLELRGTEDRPYELALTSAADAITVDLASPHVHNHRVRTRNIATRHIEAISSAGRQVHVRVSDTRSLELEADITAVASTHLDAVQLSGAETAQDVRDADVSIRRQEMRLGITPGSIRLIPILDSAAGLLELPKMLSAIDRHSAVLLDSDGLSQDLNIPRIKGSNDLDTGLTRAMWDVSVAARAAELPWLIAASTVDVSYRSLLAIRALDNGASGACVVTEAEVRGLNAIFTPNPETLITAERIVAEWSRLYKHGLAIGIVETAVEGSSEQLLVDRRTVRRARTLLARAQAIKRRERAR